MENNDLSACQPIVPCLLSRLMIGTQTATAHPVSCMCIMYVYHVRGREVRRQLTCSALTEGAVGLFLASDFCQHLMDRKRERPIPHSSFSTK